MISLVCLFIDMYTKLSASSPVHLPDGATVDVGICQISTRDCHLLTPKSEMDKYIVRVDSHAYGMRYAQLYLSFQALNVSFEYAAMADDTLHIRVSSVGKYGGGFGCGVVGVGIWVWV